MECYTAFSGVEYEGTELLGVFTSFERAKAAVLEDLERRRTYMRNFDDTIERVQRDFVKDVRLTEWTITIERGEYYEIILCELNKSV